MNMAKILNYKFSEEIDRKLYINTEYAEADRDINNFMDKELSKEKAQQLDDLLCILLGTAGEIYVEEGMKLGAKLVIALLHE